MTSEKLPWALTPAKRSFEQFPDPGDYERLGAEFAAADASRMPDRRPV
jgi:hypothetical protein